MDEVFSFLKEWTINYIKNKDILMGSIESIEENKEGFDIIVKYKDRITFFFIRPLIRDIEEIIKKMGKEGHYGLVMLNNRENLNIIIKNWKRLVEFKGLCIYFVNQFSQLDKKWIVFPYTHNRICDDSSLEAGLKAMFEMVEPVTEEDVKAKLKNKSN